MTDTSDIEDIKEDNRKRGVDLDGRGREELGDGGLYSGYTV